MSEFFENLRNYFLPNLSSLIVDTLNTNFGNLYHIPMKSLIFFLSFDKISPENFNYNYIKFSFKVCTEY